MLGYLHVVRSPDCPSLEVSTVCVHPSSRGQGLGRRLMSLAISLARDQRLEWVQLHTRESNATAQSLYESMHFSVVGRTPGYYQQPVEAALQYQLPLHCTFSALRGKEFTLHPRYFRCLDCCHHPHMSICQACIQACHSGHRTRCVGSGHCYCDCGANEDFPRPCQCLRQEKQDPPACAP